MQQYEPDFIDLLSEEVLRRRPTWKHLGTRLLSLRGLGIQSNQDLVQALPGFSGEALLAALDIVGILEIKRAGPAVVQFVTSSDATVCHTALTALSSMRSRRTYRSLARIAKTHSDTRIATAACHALAFTFDSAAAELLFDILLQRNLPPAVRAQAAEGMGNLLGLSDRRTKLFKRVANSLIEALNDPSSEMRFWCAFALGQMRTTKAETALAHLAAQDRQICPGWWSVGEEASDALAYIRGGEWPERTPLGWTETGEPKMPDESVPSSPASIHTTR